MKSADIRQAFLDFFADKGHTVVPSSSLVPHDDPTLLFTNAGMNQFKDVFLGLEKRDYSRAVSSQKCVRAGGKHNDLENVGYTARHHTFFEMLGNFSFGDYFKKDAIHFAWEFLTSDKWLNIPQEKLWITVYENDDEAFDIWSNDIGLSQERIIRIGDNKGAPYASDNFWAMGDTGPCGPCTEIFYDHGEHIPGGLPGTPEEDGDRYIEIWNNVFMQYNRTADGEMHPLPAPSVDTGMGLERISAVLQGVHANYEIDLFQSLLNAAATAVGCNNENQDSLKVLADHIRSCAFLIADGVIPSNEGRGYVLRRIIRRAIRHGHKLGATDTFFYKMVDALVQEMGEAFPELKQQQQHIEQALQAEEEQFARTLDKGMAVLEGNLASLESVQIPGDVVFLLYDTYGFPVDLTNDIARERDLTLDMEGYEQCMEAQRTRARATGTFSVVYDGPVALDEKTEFTGYEKFEDESVVVAIYKDNKPVDKVSAGDQAQIVLDKTPFYAESGGQVGDMGNLDFQGGRFYVSDTRKLGEGFLHIGKLEKGEINKGDTLDASIDKNQREQTAHNHSATHLLHAALRKVLGDHVQQKGSLVDSGKLRFDFSHNQPVSPEQLKEIEKLVNEQIVANTEVKTTVTDMESAKDMGAMALFGEKYGDTVRVLSMGSDDFSIELCGGTHVKQTGDIGLFHIVSETGVASGVRRIEALTGNSAYTKLNAEVDELDRAANRIQDENEELFEELFKLDDGATSVIPPKRVETNIFRPVFDAGSFATGGARAVENIAHFDQAFEHLNGVVAQLQDKKKMLQRHIEKVKSAKAASSVDALLEHSGDMHGVQVLAVQLEGVEGNALRDLSDQFRSKLGTSVVLLAAVNDDKVSLVAAVSKDATSRIKAGDLMKEVAPIVGGKGGGRPDMAQGGGTDIAAVEKALDHARQWIAKTLS